MIDLTCPMCRTPLQLVTRHTPAPLTVEQRLYTWLFDLILDRTATVAEKTRAREIMRLTGLAKSRRRDQPTRYAFRPDANTIGQWIRLVINERAGDQ